MTGHTRRRHADQVGAVAVLRNIGHGLTGKNVGQLCKRQFSHRIGKLAIQSRLARSHSAAILDVTKTSLFHATESLAKNSKYQARI
jgi:hypothetical protein